MDPVFLNKSCDPFSSPEEECAIGSYVQYVVNVSSILHIVETLDFVKMHNIRLVIKNTGHDYMGKPTAKGGLSLWMHHLTAMEFLDDYASSLYKGPAVKVHAGITSEQLLKAASQRGLVAVSGACPTIGFAGGYIPAGAHSPLSSTYGLATDQALSYEVITPKGEFVVASPQENQDLYWALSGGGAGNYGIVWSVTVKLFRDVPVTVGKLAFSVEGISPDTYWKAIAAYQSRFVKHTNFSAYAFYSAAEFTVDPIVAPGVPARNLEVLFEPLFTELRLLNVKFRWSIKTYQSYLQAYEEFSTFRGIDSVGNVQLSNRILPRSLWDNDTSIFAMTQTFKSIAENGAIFADIAIHAPLAIAGYPNNSVFPAWREAKQVSVVILPIVNGQSQEQTLKDQDTLSSILTEPLRKLAPDSGAYMNEASPIEPSFKQAFYGFNYDTLLTIKQTWDPEHILYGPTSVGGDLWYQTEEGRLCKTSLLSKAWGRWWDN